MAAKRQTSGHSYQHSRGLPNQQLLNLKLGFFQNYSRTKAYILYGNEFTVNDILFDLRQLYHSYGQNIVCYIDRVSI